MLIFVRIARFPHFSLVCVYSDKHKQCKENAPGISVNYLGNGIMFRGRHAGQACLLLTVFTRLFGFVFACFLCVLK